MQESGHGGRPDDPKGNLTDFRSFFEISSTGLQDVAEDDTRVCHFDHSFLRPSGHKTNSREMKSDNFVSRLIF
jgi:hypothetical protein